MMKFKVWTRIFKKLFLKNSVKFCHGLFRSLSSALLFKKQIICTCQQMKISPVRYFPFLHHPGPNKAITIKFKFPSLTFPRAIILLHNFQMLMMRRKITRNCHFSPLPSHVTTDTYCCRYFDYYNLHKAIFTRSCCFFRNLVICFLMEVLLIAFATFLLFICWFLPPLCVYSLFDHMTAFTWHTSNRTPL